MRILYLILLSLIIIGGCNAKTIDNDELKAIDLNIYNGKWISKNYQVIKMDGYEAGFGSELYLTYKEQGVINISMYDISAPPISRIASIETDTKISIDGKGDFSFDDDGWGSYGSGTIEFHKDQVIVNIKSLTEKDNPDWRIYSGERIFVRGEK